jgi:hypothetical protein
LNAWEHAVDDERHFRLKTFEKAPDTRAQGIHAVGDRFGFGNDRLSNMCKFRLSRRPAIKKGNAKLRLQRVDRVTNGGGGPPQALCSSSETALFDHGQQHQKLVNTWSPWRSHFEYPEKNFQFYTDFVD